MRSVLILPALSLVALLSACGTDGGKAGGPERRSAAGEVLGGEVSDDMLPLDTVKSTSPAGRSDTAEDVADPSHPNKERGATLPKPEISGGPEPLPNVPPGVDPTDGPTPG